MKTIVLAVVSMFLARAAFGGEQPCLKSSDANAPVPVFVTANIAESGFTNPNKGVADSTKNLISSLKGKKSVCLAGKREDASIVLEVLDREKAQMTASFLGTSRDCTVNVKFSFGDFETTLSGSAAGGTVTSGGAWGKAAGKVAKQVDRWVVENRERIAAAQK